ncbi:MAG: macro domain-containing protein [Candidatus Aminicenantes bacterium]|nr:MAG: macro domain-containing protein [Candidatus Aminicenantes bacterium]
MIKTTQGDLLKADVDALVNTVNCVGVMGKGIALQFKLTFPENFNQYYQACRKNQVKIGKMFVVKCLTGVKYIINFPTKKHWKEKSNLEYIKRGLKNLVETIRDLKITSIAIPPLGCGLGGLNWPEVKKVIFEELKILEHVDIYLYEPGQSPKPAQIKVRTKEPAMTRGRALLIRLVQQYIVPGYQLTLLEIQKLMYFLQEAGEPLRLKYEKQQYGPYAHNLEHVLQRIEGHFIRGYGDRTRSAPIKILKKGMIEAEKYLQENPGSLDKLDEVARLIRGFETPYGLELLSTVHWAIVHEKKIHEDEIILFIRNWNKRKANLFSKDHINKAIIRLKAQSMVYGK